jgi:hypothetical protein
MWSVRRARVFFLAIGTAGTAWAACGSTGGSPDAALDAARADSTPGADAAAQDGGPPLLWVDFAAVGCERFDPSVPACRGTAPLVLRFVALAPAPVDSYVWSFGDGGSNGDASPLHTFAQPGSYAVSLAVGGSGGTAQRERDGYVVVDAAPLGAGCTAGSQCATGLECVLGFCARGCAQASCDTGAVCAGLGDGPESWQRPLCLRACAGDGDCAAGLRCRELRSGAGDAWVKGCFTGALGDDGQSCVDPHGTLDDGLCASGSCRDLGARGLCALPCGGAEACASYAACATMHSGESLCLARCGSCAGDPWLGCEMPGGAGDLGFEAPAGSYCAPRRCVGGDCGPDGLCQGGFCRANR